MKTAFKLLAVAPAAALAAAVVAFCTELLGRLEFLP